MGDSARDGETVTLIEEEITPSHLRCGWGSCPGVYTPTNEGREAIPTEQQIQTTAVAAASCSKRLGHSRALLALLLIIAQTSLSGCLLKNVGYSFGGGLQPTQDIIPPLSYIRTSLRLILSKCAAEFFEELQRSPSGSGVRISGPYFSQERDFLKMELGLVGPSPSLSRKDDKYWEQLGFTILARVGNDLEIVLFYQMPEAKSAPSTEPLPRGHKRYMDMDEEGKAKAMQFQDLLRAHMSNCLSGTSRYGSMK